MGFRYKELTEEFVGKMKGRLPRDAFKPYHFEEESIVEIPMGKNGARKEELLHQVKGAMDELIEEGYHGHTWGYHPHVNDQQERIEVTVSTMEKIFDLRRRYGTI